MKDTNNQNEDAGIGLIFFIIIGFILYCFGVFDEYIDDYQKQVEVDNDRINQLQQEVKNRESIKDKLNRLQREARESCEDFATELHQHKNFEIYQKTTIESFTLTSINLNPLRNCDVVGINITENKNVNAIVMQCKTAGPNYLSKGVTASCVLDSNLQPTKIKILNEKLSHSLSGLGDVGNLHIPSINAFGDMLGAAVSGDVKFKIFDDEYINLSTSKDFVKELTNLASMEKVESVNLFELRKFQAELKRYDDKILGFNVWVNL